MRRQERLNQGFGFDLLCLPSGPLASRVDQMGRAGKREGAHSVSSGAEMYLVLVRALQNIPRSVPTALVW